MYRCIYTWNSSLVNRGHNNTTGSGNQKFAAGYRSITGYYIIVQAIRRKNLLPSFFLAINFCPLILVAKLVKAFNQFVLIETKNKFSLQCCKLFCKLHYKILLLRLKNRFSSIAFRKRQWR